MGYFALSQVLSGWTGTIAVTYSGVTTTITPRTRESVASLFARLIHDVYGQAGLALRVAIDSPTIFAVSAASSFDMATSGTVGSRTGLTDGTYTGAASYSGPDDADSLSVPSIGGRLLGPVLSSETGRATSAGGAGHTMMALGRTTLTLTSTLAQAWTLEQTSGVYDVWADGRVFGRVRIDGWTRSPPTRRRSDYAELVATVQAVSE
jgi:hypothetical protein